MERREYEKLDAVEDEMWWFRALHANIVAQYRRRAGASSPTAGAALDAGCGTGGLLARLAEAFARHRLSTVELWGIDADPTACAAARRKSRRPVCAGSVNALPCRDNALAAVFSADVLCHRNVDEARALRDFHRCLAPGGILVLNLPAYDWLLSPHDHAVHNVRRYTKRGICRRLAAAGFAEIRASYWNTFLFPLMLLRRTVLASPDGSSDVMHYPMLIERLCRAVTGLETWLLRRGVALPFGGSIVASAIKR